MQKKFEIFFSLLLFSIIIVSQSQLAVQNGTAFLLSSYYNIGPNITLYWDFNMTNNTVTFTIQWINNNFGYVGIGYGNSLMPYTDITVAFVKNGMVTVQDIYATAEALPSQDINIPFCHDDIILLGYNISDSTFITYQRAINTNDPCDFELTQNPEIAFIWAQYDEEGFGYHESNRGATVINFTQGATPPIPLHNGTAFLPSSYNILTDKISLYWDFNITNNTIVMALVTDITLGWVGIGYDSEDMAGSTSAGVDMTIFAISKDGVSASDYVSFGEAQPPLDINQGCQDNIQLLGYTINATKTVITYSRPIDTGDKCDTVLNPSDSYHMIWAYYDTPYLSYHFNNYGSVLTNFVQGASGKSAAIKTFKSLITTIHAWFLVIGWGFLIDIALVFGRYLRGWNKYILVHALLAGIIVIGTLFLEIILIVLSN